MSTQLGRKQPNGTPPNPPQPAKKSSKIPESARIVQNFGKTALSATRHVSYVRGGVVDGIQLRIPWCEEDSLEALGEFIANAAVGHLSEKPLVENRRHAGEVVSSVGDTVDESTP